MLFTILSSRAQCIAPLPVPFKITLDFRFRRDDALSWIVTN